MIKPRSFYRIIYGMNPMSSTLALPLPPLEPPLLSAEISAEATSELHTQDVIEIPLLLPVWQILALEQVAHARGLTAGEMVRQLLGNFCQNTQI